MFDSIYLRNFKSFDETRVSLNPFTLLVGANAGGKSNLREAFRFFHGISRGYTLAEIVGEKWIEGGVRVWTGTRGGAANICRHGASEFSLGARFWNPNAAPHLGDTQYEYRIDVRVHNSHKLTVVREHLKTGGRYVFDTHPDNEARGKSSPTIRARIRKYGGGHPPDDTFLEDRPILGQILGSTVATDATKRATRGAIDALSSMAFLDLSPSAAREASPVGIEQLGDRGENLSSVLQGISAGGHARTDQLTSWIRALTPLDARDLAYVEDLNGRVMAQLLEGEHYTPLSAASDGTVRFLAMVAALLNVSRPRLIFFEEIENGIHPNRIYLLLDLISQSVGVRSSQILATSHSPQLLVHALRNSNAGPCLIYRREGEGSRVVNVAEHSALLNVLEGGDPARLMSAGWFEDVVDFLDEEELAQS